MMRNLLYLALSSTVRLPWQFFELVGREAAPATTRVYLIRTLGQALLMGIIFLLLGVFVVYTIETWLGLARWRFASMLWTTVGFVLFWVGGIVSWSSAYFMVTRGDGTPLPAATTRRLVIAGPYRWIRNPMACGSLTQGAALGLLFGSPLILIYTLSGALFWNFLVRPWEEFDLERRFGADYVRYKGAVRCWIPRLTRYE